MASAPPPEQSYQSQGQHQQGGYTPQQGYPAQQGYPPQKQKHTLRNVILVGLGVMILLFGGCMALIAGTANEIDKAIEESESITSENDTDSDTVTGGGDSGPGAPEPGKNKVKAAPGQVIGNWKILNKPQIKQEYGMFGTADLEVENISDSEDEPWLEIRLTNGRNLVTTFDCIGRTIRPGERAVLECTSMDDYRPWKQMEILNAF